MKWRKIRDVSPDHNCNDVFEDYSDSIFLTFDLDWVCDDILADTISIVERADVEATWFITHYTPLLARLRENPKFELGIHPNFNNILAGSPDSVNGEKAEDTVDKLLALVPEARSVRSHSMTQSSSLLTLFAEKGLSHDCNHFIPHQAELNLRPWLVWNGLIKVPCFWEDDIAALYGEDFLEVGELIHREGVKVFDFHPIHVFLNTEDMMRYENSRDYHRYPEKLVGYQNRGNGSRTALMRLLEL
ncbi:MAG: hypothetical protein CSA26_05145 [Desulfobacterales bacterium]|nr:MAG: hypothetical protein CSA26_05145 [Desulfobacterales bacterium]